MLLHLRFRHHYPADLLHHLMPSERTFVPKLAELLLGSRQLVVSPILRGLAVDGVGVPLDDLHWVYLVVYELLLGVEAHRFVGCLLEDPQLLAQQGQPVELD
jgi:hypothetical protein